MPSRDLIERGLATAGLLPTALSSRLPGAMACCGCALPTVPLYRRSLSREVKKASKRRKGGDLRIEEPHLCTAAIVLVASGQIPRAT